MALLSFPGPPLVNGQLYPTSPLPGQNQYEWDAANQTWRLLGTATTVTPGCYGNGFYVPTFCVDAQGRITSAVDVPIATVLPDLQIVTDQGAVTTNVIDVAGIISAGLTYPTLDGVSGDVLVTDGAGTLSFSPLPTETLQSVTDNGSVTTNTIDVAGLISGTLVSAGLTYPVVDGAAGDLLSTDGAGNLSFVTPAVEDLQSVTDNGATTTNVIDVAGLISSGLTYPTTDGLIGDYLSTDGAGNLSFVAPAIETLQSVTNNGSVTTNAITVAGLTAAGLNYPLIDGAAGDLLNTDGAGNLSFVSPAIEDLQSVTDNGSVTTNVITAAGIVAAGLNYPLADGLANDVLITDGAGNLSFSTPIAETLQGVTDNGATTTNVITVAGLISAGLTYPVADGLAGYLLSTDGAGNLSFTSPAAADNLQTVTDNGSVTTNTINVGGLIASSLTYPTLDGVAGDFLTTDGSGNLSFVAPVAETLQTVTDRGSTTTKSITVGGLTAASLFYPTSDGLTGDFLTTDGAGTLSFITPPIEDLQSVTNNGSVTTNSITVASLIAAGLTYPISDGLSGDVLSTDGSGNLSFINPPGQNLQLVTDNGSTTTNTIDVGGLIAAGLTYPGVDGAAGDFITTDGAGNLSFVTPAVNDLQSVTDNGSTTTNAITVAGLTAASLNYPLVDGAAGEVMTTDGAGNLGWLATTQIVATPGSSASPGSFGQISFGAGNFYFHDGVQWLQVAGVPF